jgi:hypothetical protein
MNLTWCNTLNSTESCPTLDGIACYNILEGLYVTYDGVNVSSINNSKDGSYCVSTDGLTCQQNNGINCDLTDGYDCATSD